MNGVMVNNGNSIESRQKALAALKELSADNTVPKNVQLRIQDAIKELELGREPSICVSRALQHIEEVAEDNNMLPDTRMALYNIASLLEIV